MHRPKKGELWIQFTVIAAIASFLSAGGASFVQVFLLGIVALLMVYHEWILYRLTEVFA